MCRTVLYVLVLTVLYVPESGHSAQLLALFALMEPGDTIVAATRLYGNCRMWHP